MKKLELFFKNILLNILLMIYRAPAPKSKIQLSPSFKILLIRLNRIGDALVTTPLITEIKKSSGAEIHVLADRKNFFIFSKHPDISKLVKFQKGFAGIKEFRKLVSEENYDVLVDMHDDVSTTVSFLTAISGVPHRVALRKENYKIFTETVERPDSKVVHVVDRNMKLAEPLNLSFNKDEINIKYSVGKEAVNSAEEFLNKNSLNKNYLFGINISAGSDARFWGVERFKSVITDLESKGLSILIISAEKDFHHAEKIADGKYPVFCSPDFEIFAAMISKLDFLFTPDTSIIHLASAFRVPLYGLYVKYNTEDVIWYPYKSEYDVVVTEEPNFENLNYDVFRTEFLTFFEKIFNAAKLN